MSAGEPRLSILHLCGEGHPSGQTRVILDLARAQTAAGHRVTASGPEGSVLDASIRAAGVTAAPLRFDGDIQQAKQIAQPRSKTTISHSIGILKQRGDVQPVARVC